MNGQTALAVLRAEKHISISAISCFTCCPRQHQHRYILHTSPAHRPAAMAFGSAIHTALALFYRRLMDTGSEATVEELETVFSDSWCAELNTEVPVLFDGRDNHDTLLDVGVQMVRVFHSQAERPHRVVAVEEAFSIEIGDPITGLAFEERLVGVLDAVVQDLDGGYQILEHKTAARRWTADRLAFDPQITAYMMAAPLIGFGQADVQVQLLLRTKSPALERLHPRRTELDRKDLLDLLSGVLVAIQAHAFYPIRGWHCRSCAFAGPCLAG